MQKLCQNPAGYGHGARFYWAGIALVPSGTCAILTQDVALSSRNLTNFIFTEHTACYLALIVTNITTKIRKIMTI